MDLQYLRRLVKIFDDSSATELEIEEEGVKLYISKNSNEVNIPAQPIVQMQPQAAPAQLVPQTVQASVTQPAETQPAAAAASEEDSSLHAITSPIVGTFYRAPSPESDPFVEVGTHVTPGQTLCIVEAMKLMNEIESDVAGTVEKILIENAQPVEYGQKMFLIKPD